LKAAAQRCRFSRICFLCSGRIVNEKDQEIARANRRQEEQARRIHVLEAELERHGGMQGGVSWKHGGMQNSVIGSTAFVPQQSPEQQPPASQQQQQQVPPPPLPATPASAASLDSGRLSRTAPTASWSPTTLATPPSAVDTGVGGSGGGGRAAVSSLSIESPFFSAEKQEHRQRWDSNARAAE
jgi:hypothetical protein